MTSADFLLNDTPQSAGVYRATPGGTVTLKLADGMLIDAGVVTVTLERKTKGATDIAEIAAAYILDPPSEELDLTIPDEVSSWLVRVQLNNGSSARGVEPTWTRERVIETVGAAGIAKQLAGERTERHPERGWSDIQNDMVDVLNGALAGSLRSHTENRTGTVTPDVSLYSAFQAGNCDSLEKITGALAWATPTGWLGSYQEITLRFILNGTNNVTFSGAYRFGNNGEPNGAPSSAPGNDGEMWTVKLYTFDGERWECLSTTMRET